MWKAMAAGKHTNQKTLQNINYVSSVTTNKTEKDILLDVIKKEMYIPDPDHGGRTKLKG